jgi:hypothetical protein
MFDYQILLSPTSWAQITYQLCLAFWPRLERGKLLIQFKTGSLGAVSKPCLNSYLKISQFALLIKLMKQDASFQLTKLQHTGYGLEKLQFYIGYTKQPLLGLLLKHNRKLGKLW